MTDDSEISPIFVLHKTILHDSFRYYPEFKMENIDEVRRTRFIFRFIIERQAELPDNQYMAFTSKPVFEAFIKAFKFGEKLVGSGEIIPLLANTVYRVDEEPINSLSEDESVIAIADKVYSLSGNNYETVLVCNPSCKANLLRDILAFYQAKLGKTFKEKDIPFRFYDSKEAEAYIEGKFPEISKLIKNKRTSPLF